MREHTHPQHTHDAIILPFFSQEWLHPRHTMQPRTTRRRSSTSVTECSSCKFPEQCEPSLSPLRHPRLEPSFPVHFTQRTSKNSRQQLITIASEQTGTGPLIAYASKRVQCPALLGHIRPSRWRAMHEYRYMYW